MPTYRTNGAWGSGIGVNLTPAQVDGNFYELRTDLDDVIANPPTADGLVSVTQSGFYLTFHTTLGNELGPIAIPVVYTVWRGDWAPFTIYSAADIFRVADSGIFSVLQGHTSAAIFDPDEAGGSPLAPYYNELIGVSSLPADTSIDDLNDVTITSVADGDLIAWDNGSSQWTNRTPGDVLTLLAPTLDDLTDVVAPSPVVGQILTYLGGSPDQGWQPDTLSLDDLDDVSVAAPSDGNVLTYQAGSPTGWIAEAPAAIPTTLDALTDVIAPTPSDGDLLQFDGVDWINSAGSAISDLTDAFLPLVGSDLFEISQSTGSPPGSPPIGYESRKATLANILSAGGFTLGSTSISLGGIATTVTALTLSGATLTGTTTLPGSGSLSSTGNLTISPASGNGSARVDAIAGQQTAFFLLSGGLNRWLIAKDNTTESGSNAGSNLSMSNYNDAGGFLGFPFFIERSTGNFGIGVNTVPQAKLQIGRSAATARIYNAFTDTSNSEWAYLGSWGPTANVATFGADKNGTGTYRPVALVAGGIETARLRTNGDFQQGSGSALATNATGGFFLIHSGAGAPTGAPTNATAAEVPMYYDTTNNQLYIYNGGWKQPKTPAGAALVNWQ